MKGTEMPGQTLTPRSSVAGAIYLLSALMSTSVWRYSDGRIRSGDLYLPSSGTMAKRWVQESFSVLSDGSLASTPIREHGFYWVRLVYLTLTKIVQNDALAERLFLTLIILVAMVSMHVLLTYLELERWITIFGSLLFALLPTHYNFLAFGWYLLYLQLALVPLLLRITHKFFTAGSTASGLGVGLLSGLIFFTTSLTPVILLVLTVLVITAWSIRATDDQRNIRRSFNKLFLFVSGATLSNLFWIASAVLSAFKSERSFIGATINSVSLGTSRNVSSHTPITLWGTGFNSSYEIAATAYGPRSLYFLITPCLAILGLIGSWKLKIAKPFFLICFILLILMACSDQIEVIGLLAQLGIGRDSGRLYSIGAVLLIPLVANSLKKISVLDQTLAVVVAALVIFAYAIPYFRAPLSALNRPVEPAQSWAQSKKVDEGYDTVVDLLAKTASGRPVLYFPSFELVTARNDPRFKFPYHNFPNLQFPSRTVWTSSSPGFESFRSKILEDLFNEGDAHDLIKVANKVGAFYIIFHKPTLTDQELSLLNRTRRDLSRDPRVSDVSRVVFQDGQAPFEIYRVLSPRSRVDLLANGNQIPFSLFVRSPTEMFLTLPAEIYKGNLQLHLQLLEGFRDDWKAEIRLLNSMPTCHSNSNKELSNGAEVAGSCVDYIDTLFRSARSTGLSPVHTSAPDRVGLDDDLAQEKWLEGFNYFSWDIDHRAGSNVIIKISLRGASLMQGLLKVQIVITGSLIMFYAVRAIRLRRTSKSSAE